MGVVVGAIVCVLAVIAVLIYFRRRGRRFVARNGAGNDMELSGLGEGASGRAESVPAHDPDFLPIQTTPNPLIRWRLGHAERLCTDYQSRPREYREQVACRGRTIVAVPLAAAIPIAWEGVAGVSMPSSPHFSYVLSADGHSADRSLASPDTEIEFVLHRDGGGFSPMQSQQRARVELPPTSQEVPRRD